MLLDPKMLLEERVARLMYKRVISNRATPSSEEVLRLYGAVARDIIKLVRTTDVSAPPRGGLPAPPDYPLDRRSR